jgi:putative peptidoglycan lipid II flippase
VLLSGRTFASFARLVVVRFAGVTLNLGVSVLIANRFGAGAQADAFFFARSIVLELAEALRRVVLAHLIPAFVEARARGATAERRLVRSALSSVSAIGLVLAAAAILLAESIVDTIVPGFDGERRALAVQLFKITSLLLPAMLVIALLASILNANRRFGFAEIAAVAPRLAAFLVLLLAASPVDIRLVAWALALGAVAGLGLLVVVLLRGRAADGRDRAHGTGTPGPGDRFGSIVVLQVCGQAAIWIDYGFASMLAPGAIAALEYSHRLIEAVPAMVAMSIVTITYSEMANRTRDGSELPAMFARTVQTGLFVVLPIVLTMAWFSHEVVDVVLGHGAFDTEAVSTTAGLMRAYAPVVPLGLVNNLIVMALLLEPAMRRIGLFLSVYGAALAVRYLALSLLVGPLGIYAIPVAILCFSAVVVVALIASQPHYRAAVLDQAFARGLGRVALAALCFVAALASLTWLMPAFAWASTVGSLLAMASIAGAALVFYLATAIALGLPEAGQLVRLVRLRRQAG